MFLLAGRFPVFLLVGGEFLCSYWRKDRLSMVIGGENPCVPLGGENP